MCDCCETEDIELTEVKLSHRLYQFVCSDCLDKGLMDNRYIIVE